jgi:hypothetical protein
MMMSALFIVRNFIHPPMVVNTFLIGDPKLQRAREGSSKQPYP